MFSAVLFSFASLAGASVVTAYNLVKTFVVRRSRRWTD